MSGAWGCPHEFAGLCQRVNGAFCKPGMRGCVLDGKVEFEDGCSPYPRWPSSGDPDERKPTDDDKGTGPARTR